MESYYGMTIDFVDGYEIETGRYIAFDSGEIYDNKNQEYLYIHPRNCDGYCMVCLYLNSGKTKQLYVHRIIASTLIDSRLKYKDNMLVVNHLNPDNKWDNSVSNLETCTQKENISYAIEQGRFKVKGEDNPTSNLTNEQVHEICRIMETYPNKTYSSIISELNLGHLTGIESTIGKIRQGKQWVDISSQYNLQRRKAINKGVRVEVNYFNDTDKDNIKQLLTENPNLKPKEIANILSISLETDKKYRAFTTMVGRIRRKLL